MKNLPTKKSPQDEFYETFREELTSLLKFFQKTKEQGTLSNTFYEASITLLLKPDKDITKNKQTKTDQYPLLK